MSNHYLKSLEIAKRLAKLPEDKKAVFHKALEEKGIDVWQLPIVPVSIDNGESNDGDPLSFAQQRLWFIEQLETEKAIYNLSFGLRLEGNLDQLAFEKAINEILKRHHVLRTKFFNTEDGKARQRVSEYQKYTLPVESIEGDSSVDGSSVDERLDGIALNEALAPFDLTRDLMFRLKLIELNTTTSVALFTVHHIAFDFLSIPVLLKEFFAFYQCFASEGQVGIDNLVPGLPIQYSDFARWQREWQQSSDFQKQKDYWLAQLQDAPAELNLPIDLSSKGRRHLGGKRSLLLSVNISNELRQLAKQRAVTLYMPLFAVFTLLLSRYSSQDDISVGTSFANRSREETQNLLGFFVNLLVMRNQVAESDSFEQFLQKVNKTATEAYAHQDFPFDVLVDLIDTNRESQYPLFQVLFVLNRAFDSDEVAQLPDLKISAFNQEQNIARYPLTLRVDDSGDNTPLLCEMEYDADLFSDSRIESMLEHYQHLLQQVVDAPSAEVKDYALLKPSEQQALLSADIQAPDVINEEGDWTYLHQSFEQYAASTPNAIALICESETLTYAELNARANRLAHYLRAQGVERETRVGVYLDRSVHLIEAILGVLKAGGAYVPLDVHWPASRVKQILVDADVSMVLDGTNWQVDAEALALPNLQLHTLDAAELAWRDFPDTDPEPINASNDAAYVIYTSGSTGVPKGVVVEHQNIINYARAIAQRLELADRSQSFGHISTIAADLGNTSLYGALCFGSSLHLIGSERAFDPDAVAAQFAKHPADVLKIVPGHLQGLLSAKNAEDLLPTQCLILGGEACPVDLIKQVRALAPDLRIINHYGPSETTVGALTHEVPHDLTDDAIEQGHIPIGKPLANCHAYVLDQAQQLCPDGIAGTLYIGGANVARGYLNNSEQTAKRFIPNPLLPESKKSKSNRLYRTGDRVMRDKNGEIVFLGRVDSQVKIRGHRVELGDIESALNAEQDVTEALVRLVKEDVSDQLVAFVALHEHAMQERDQDKTAGMDSAARLKASLANKLPEYMVPQRIQILDELPRTQNGKIDIKRLDALFACLEDDTSDSVRFEPQNENEAVLADIWCQVLKRDQVGMEEDFFALGGDSILSLQVIARAKKRGLKITPLQLFDQPTIAALARVAKPLVSDANPADDEAAQLQILQRGDNSKAQSPVFCLHHGGGHTREYRELAEYIDQSIPVYGIQSPALADKNYHEEDIRVVAESYVNIIRERQPQGPYRLLGWSLGGVLAMAIANELEKQDQQIEFVVLIDAILSPPDIVGRYGPDTFIENFLAVFGAQAAQKYHGLDASVRKQLEDQLANMDEQEALGHTCEWIANLGILDETQIDRSYINLRYRTAVQARRLIDSYVPKKVDANLYVWWAEQSYTNDNWPTDWRVFSDKLVSEKIHPGGHYDIIEDAELHSAVAAQINKIST